MSILICKQGLFGGTDNLLDRCYNWLKKNNYDVDVYNNDKKVERLKKEYELAIIPASQMGDVWFLFKRKIIIKRILVWIMGMGAFRDAYCNTAFSSNKFLKGIYKKLKREADKTLLCLYQRNAICFTDKVGAYNTFLETEINYKQTIDRSIIPIAIDVPSQIQLLFRENKDKIRLAWIGRVSKDFKEIPIMHLINDLETWVVAHSNYKVELTIVGDGDAVEYIREVAEKSILKINFVPNIAYDKLSDFVRKEIDLLVAMGTSALDGAKCGCPTLIITPVRSGDEEKVYYRWIYESKGYSLGEFPGIDKATEQVREKFEKKMMEYLEDGETSKKSYEYAKLFSSEAVFGRLITRKPPEMVDKVMMSHIHYFYLMKNIKLILKKTLR